MRIIKKYFPYSLKADNLINLLVTILIYVIINFAGGFVLGLLTKLPLIGCIASFAGWLLSIYCVIGAVLAILLFTHILN